MSIKSLGSKGSGGSGNKAVPNLKSTLASCDKCLVTVCTHFGKKGEKSGFLTNIPNVINRLEDLKRVLEQIVQVSSENPSPHLLDSQASFVSILNMLKDNLKDLIYYADDYNKRNVLTRSVVGSKIKEKVDIILNSMTGHTRLIENLAHTHNMNLMN